MPLPSELGNASVRPIHTRTNPGTPPCRSSRAALRVRGRQEEHRGASMSSRRPPKKASWTVTCSRRSAMRRLSTGPGASGTPGGRCRPRPSTPSVVGSDHVPGHLGCSLPGSVDQRIVAPADLASVTRRSSAPPSVSPDHAEFACGGDTVVVERLERSVAWRAARAGPRGSARHDGGAGGDVASGFVGGRARAPPRWCGGDAGRARGR